MPRASRRPIVAIVAACLAGCGPSGTPGPAEGEAGEALVASKASPAYRDLDDALGGADAQRFMAARRRLAEDFADACGDSFCGGRYSNIESVSLRCALAVLTGRVVSCTWIFGASSESVGARNGAIRVDARTFACVIPVDAPPAELIDTVLRPGAERPLRRSLPGPRSGTLDEALVRCFGP